MLSETLLNCLGCFLRVFELFLVQVTGTDRAFIVFLSFSRSVWIETDIIS